LGTTGKRKRETTATESLSIIYMDWEDGLWLTRVRETGARRNVGWSNEGSKTGNNVLGMYERS